MIAYNSQELDNVQLHTLLDKAVAVSALTPEERSRIAGLYPVSLYTPNIFMRLGLFLLTVIVALFAMALVSVFILDGLGSNYAGIFIFYGLILYASLEYFVHIKKHYRSGLDDALTWMSSICLLIALVSFGNYKLSIPAYLLATSIIALFFTLRFAHAFMSAISLVAGLAFFFLKFQELGSMAKNIMPFIIMLLCAGIFFLNKMLSAKKSLRHYTNCFNIIKILTLIIFYAAGNYFIVREVGMLMNDITLPASASIPYGWFFWMFTFTIPILYIGQGLYKKDHIFLRVGLLLVAAIVFTIRFYYSIIPLEIFMVIAGAILITGSYMLSRYLSVVRNGFTARPLHVADPDNLNLEGLIIAETFAIPQKVTEPKFGGGSFGGGGASGEF